VSKHYKNPTKRVGRAQSGHHHKKMFSSGTAWPNESICPLSTSNWKKPEYKEKKHELQKVTNTPR
jgi:hypothetical protein